MHTHRHSHDRPAARDRQDLMHWQALGHAAQAGSILYLLLFVGMFATGAFGPPERYGGWSLLLFVAVVGGVLLSQTGHLLANWRQSQHPLQILLLALGCFAAALLLPTSIHWLSRLGSEDLFSAVVGLAAAVMLWLGWTQLRPFVRRRR
jgi:drug/metabolite transporter (DMT)-like permease